MAVNTAGGSTFDLADMQLFLSSYAATNDGQMLDYLTVGIGFAFAAAVQPGPFLAYAISQSLTNGWKRTLPIAFAPIMSDVPIICLVLVY